MAKGIIYKTLSYLLNGIFYEIQNKLGRYCSHKQYCDAIEAILKEKGIKYNREIEVPIKFGEISLSGNRIDFLIEDLIAIDIKTEKYITKSDFVQMVRYLRAANKKLGIIVNFRQKKLKPKRIINAKYNNIRI